MQFYVTEDAFKVGGESYFSGIAHWAELESHICNV